MFLLHLCAMKIKLTVPLLLLQFCFYFVICNGFSQTPEKKYMQWFDSTVGLENTPIYNGFLDDGDGAFERNKSYAGTQRYFKAFEFFTGNLVYENQPYYNIQMKYDVYKDELLLNLKSSKNTLFSIRPIKDRVKKFNIDNHFFINVGVYNVTNTSVNGFAELLIESSSFVLLKKHIKRREEKSENFRMLYEYYQGDYNFLYFKGGFHIIKRQKDLFVLFPEYKKQMRKYTIRKSSRDEDIKAFLKRLDVLLPNKTSAK